MRNNYGSSNFLSDAFENIRLNKLLGTATVFIFVACFIVTTSFSMLILNINRLVDEIANNNEIVLFLDDDSEETLDNINEIIASNSFIDRNNCQYITADEGLKNLIEALGPEYSQLYDEFKNDNPIRASYEIKLNDISYTDDIALLFRNIDGVGEVRTQQIRIDEFINIKNVISLLSLWLIIILIIVSIFIISNTIKMTIYARKTEINIMKFVGATDAFIRIPYIIEGIILGLIASVVAFFAQWLIYETLILNGLSKLAVFTPYDFAYFAPAMIILYVIAAVLFGVFGSLLPMRKYLNV